MRGRIANIFTICRIPDSARVRKAQCGGVEANVEINRNIIDGHTIAHMELVQNKIPFIIRRPLPNGGSEYWKISDLKHLE